MGELEFEEGKLIASLRSNIVNWKSSKLESWTTPNRQGPNILGIVNRLVVINVVALERVKSLYIQHHCPLGRGHGHLTNKYYVRYYIHYYHLF